MLADMNLRIKFHRLKIALVRFNHLQKWEKAYLTRRIISVGQVNVELQRRVVQHGFAARHIVYLPHAFCGKLVLLQFICYIQL